MRALVATLAVAAAGCGLIWQATDGGRALTAESARRVWAADHRPEITPFTVETMDGANALVPQAGRVTVVEFIYTTCPTLCQAAGPEMRQLGDRLEDSGLANRVSLYSISFDPEHDTPAQLRDYGDRMGADGRLWTLARPASDDLEAVLDAFRTVVIPDGFGGFTHNVAIHVVAPDGRLVGIYDTEDFDAVLKQIRRYAG